MVSGISDWSVSSHLPKLHYADVPKRRPKVLMTFPYGPTCNAKGCLLMRPQYVILGTYSGCRFNHNP